MGMWCFRREGASLGVGRHVCLVMPEDPVSRFRGVRVRSRADLTVTDLGDEVVLLDPRTQEMYALDDVGRFVWFASTGADLEGIAARVADRYAIGLDVAERDVAILVAELAEANLLEPWSEEPSRS